MRVRLKICCIASLAEMRLAVAAGADAVGLVGAMPSGPGPIAELGGTGRVHDWALSRRIVAESPAPVFLAGGLGPANVAEAIHSVRPWGVDVCSGLRTEGALDAAKLAAYVAAVSSCH